MDKTPRYTEGGTRDPRNPDTEHPEQGEAKQGKAQKRDQASGADAAPGSG